MDIFNQLTPEAMAEAMTKRMEQLLANGSDDVTRLRKELEKTPDDAEMWFELGLAYNQAGLQYEDMAVRLAELQYDMEHEGEPLPESGEEVTLHVNVTAVRPLYEESLKAFDKVAELEPDYYGVACQKGIVYGNMHDLENAEACYLQALKDDDEDFTAAYYLSIVYGDMGKADLAEEYACLAEKLND